MLTISNSIKKIALSLLVVGLAIGTQSYINAEKNEIGKAKRVGAITADYLIQPSLNSFAQYPVGTPSPESCLSTSERHCFYGVSSIGKDSIPDLTSYTISQIDAYISKGWITPGSGSLNQKLYLAP